MRWRLLIVGVVVLLGAGLAAPTLAAPALAQPSQPQAAATGTPLYAFNSGLVLNGTSAASGAKIQAGSDHDGPAQRWLLEGDGTIRLSANPNLCLDVPAFNYASGVQLDVYTCKGSTNQEFIQTVPSPNSPVLAIAPQGHSSLCLNVKGGLAAGAGAAVILYACSAGTTGVINEAWSTTNLAGSTEQIGSINGYPLNASGGGGAGAAAVSWPDRGTLNEYWQEVAVTVSGFPQELEFRPVYDTSLCLATPGAETLRAPVVLAVCTGAATQAFAAAVVNANAVASVYFLTAHDGRYCLNYQGGGAQGHPAILYTCRGTGGNDLWQTSLDLQPQVTYQFGLLGLDGYAGTSVSQPVLDVSGTGSGASVVADQNDPTGLWPASQVWTDLPPAGESSSTASNPDGSISLHPLSDVSLCLTVPGANYTAGQALQVQTCDGQEDQEFFRLNSPVNDNFSQLLPWGDGQLCVGGPATGSPDGPAELQTCDGQGHQAWSNVEYSWASWGGFGGAISPYPQDFAAGAPVLGLTGAGAAGGSAALVAASGLASQAWRYTFEPASQTYAFVSLYDTAWCLGAPARSPAGTVATVSPCDQQTNQGFVKEPVPGQQADQLVWNADASLCLAKGTADAAGITPVVLAACSITDTSQYWYFSF